MNNIKDAENEILSDIQSKFLALKGELIPISDECFTLDCIVS